MKHISLLFIAMLLISCSGSKNLLNSLNKHQAPLDYLHDSKIRECDKTATLTLTQFDNHALDSLTTVSKINHKLLPFIIYNYNELNLAVNMGQSSLEQDYSDFFKKSFTVESQRTGCYTLTDQVAEPEYSVEITYDTCRINSKYQSNSSVLFLLLAYSMSFQEIGFPAQTDLALNVNLKENNNTIFEKNYSVKRTQPFINAQTRDVNRLRSDFVTNMAESLSLSTKDCIEQIITDLNKAINNK